MKAITIIGNCQTAGIASALRMSLPGSKIFEAPVVEIKAGKVDIESLIKQSEVLIVQDQMPNHVLRHLENANGRRIINFPAIFFTGLQPDCVAGFLGRTKYAPEKMLHSAICLFAWKHQLGVEQTVRLFDAEVYGALGYYDHWEASCALLMQDAARMGLDLSHEFERWRQYGAFLCAPNHPRIVVLAGIARELLRVLGVKPFVPNSEEYIADTLVRGPVWPVYPEIARPLGLTGDYIFKMGNKFDKATQKDEFRMFDLEGFVRFSFDQYGKAGGAVSWDREQSPAYDAVLKLVKRGPKPKVGNPYAGSADHQLWRRAVAAPAVGDVDPVVRTKFKIARTDRVATAGSCFAQHVAKALARSGYNYFVPEAGEALPPEEAVARNYGVFSARYGNIYTTRQLVQLFDRSEGRFDPAETAWQRADGRLVDPYRPQVEPAGLASDAEVGAARDVHLGFVRQMWRELDVFVFTLGLTEGWRSKADGAVFPLAPGVAAGSFDTERHEYHNFTVQETIDDLEAFIARLATVNPRARIILTVSPVPLIATYEDRHVLASTTYSKSVLRVAAEQVARAHGHVDYFPSYEIITGAYARGAYFEADLREVKPEGVAHVMGVFLKHYSAEGEAVVAAPLADRPPVAAARPSAALDSLRAELMAGQTIICDEEEIERSIG